MKNFKLYYKKGEQLLPITFFDTVVKSTNCPTATYDEHIEITENDQTTFTFSISKYYWEGEDAPSGEVRNTTKLLNPWYNKLQIHSQIRLIIDDVQVFDLVIKEIKPNVENTNPTVSYTTQDYFSYILTRHQHGFSYCNVLDSEFSFDVYPELYDGYGVENIFEIAQKILRKAHLYEWQVSYNTKLNESLGQKKISLDIEDSNPYNVIVEACNILNVYLQVSYVNKTIGFVEKNTLPFSGYRYTPNHNLRAIDVAYNGEELTTLLRIQGGTDENDEYVYVAPTFPSAVSKWLTWFAQSNEATMWDGAVIESECGEWNINPDSTYFTAEWWGKIKSEINDNQQYFYNSYNPYYEAKNNQGLYTITIDNCEEYGSDDTALRIKLKDFYAEENGYGAAYGQPVKLINCKFSFVDTSHGVNANWFIDSTNGEKVFLLQYELDNEGKVPTFEQFKKGLEEFQNQGRTPCVLYTPSQKDENIDMFEEEYELERQEVDTFFALIERIPYCGQFLIDLDFFRNNGFMSEAQRNNFNTLMRNMTRWNILSRNLTQTKLNLEFTIRSLLQELQGYGDQYAGTMQQYWDEKNNYKDPEKQDDETDDKYNARVQQAKQAHEAKLQTLLNQFAIIEQNTNSVLPKLATTLQKLNGGETITTYPEVVEIKNKFTNAETQYRKLSAKLANLRRLLGTQNSSNLEDTMKQAEVEDLETRVETWGTMREMPFENIKDENGNVLYKGYGAYGYIYHKIVGYSLPPYEGYGLPIAEAYRQCQQNLEALESQLYIYFGDYIVESVYSNEDELDPISLYNQAIQYFEDINKPKATYGIQVLSTSQLEKIFLPIERIGSKIRIYNEELQLADGSTDPFSQRNNELMITSISYDLRDPEIKEFGVEKITMYDSIIQKLIQTVKRK